MPTIIIEIDKNKSGLTIRDLSMRQVINKYRNINIPENNIVTPNPPKKWLGRCENLVVKAIVRKSKNPLKNLSNPYFDFPNSLFL